MREGLLAVYEDLKEKIDARLAEFKFVDRGDAGRLFEELTFCVLTPQSRASSALIAVDELKATNLLLRGSSGSIAGLLRRTGVRFHNQKARYVVTNRSLLRGDPPRIIEVLTLKPSEAREALVKEAWGIGYKEASHFLRNVGVEGLAVLDRHIISWMMRAGKLDESPRSLSRRKYLDLERRFLLWAEELNVKPEALDLLLWYLQTGELLK
ncbi:MAG: N-glycosylase/DNA lyase [Thaumarchaeota archaeon]|nr:N-glycosylase/DNA lyase [Candidatus Calditenuaceae archaeon]MDW8187591.1 N-glycosylase/DNA lyase [Nitrososphaerota archaeon]